MVVEHKWSYKLSTQVDGASTPKSVCLVYNQPVPPFSMELFLDCLDRLIFADDQVCHNNLIHTYSHISLVNSCR